MGFSNVFYFCIDFLFCDVYEIYVFQEKNLLDWYAKVGSQEIPGVTGKFGLGVQNEAGQRLTVLPRS